jgi:hypothetical protein
MSDEELAADKLAQIEDDELERRREEAIAQVQREVDALNVGESFLLPASRQTDEFINALDGELYNHKPNWDYLCEDDIIIGITRIA